MVCAALFFLGAVFDECGQCTGGTTGLKYNFLKNADCANTCGKSELDECGLCQNKKVQKSFKDCNNVCFGKARINVCNICTGGNTTKPILEGLDACGVCNGDDKSCQGCDAVANSGKVTDSCGKCLSKTDPEFDTTCFAMTSLFPTSASASGGDEIVVNGAGFNADETICFFEGTEYRYELRNPKSEYDILFYIPSLKKEFVKYFA